MMDEGITRREVRDVRQTPGASVKLHVMWATSKGRVHKRIPSKKVFAIILPDGRSIPKSGMMSALMRDGGGDDEGDRGKDGGDSGGEWKVITFRVKEKARRAIFFDKDAAPVCITLPSPESGSTRLKKQMAGTRMRSDASMTVCHRVDVIGEAALWIQDGEPSQIVSRPGSPTTIPSTQPTSPIATSLPVAPPHSVAALVTTTTTTTAPISEPLVQHEPKISWPIVSEGCNAGVRDENPLSESSSATWSAQFTLPPLSLLGDSPFEGQPTMEVENF